MMDKTININLGGSLFTVDEEAYRILRDYLQAIDLKFRNIAGGNETIEDIESRIAEIFLSQKGTAGVITKENVEAMIKTIGKPEDFGQNETEGSAYQHTAPRKSMFRNPENSIFGGVCGGIGAYLNTDPVWIRVLFVIFAVFFGIGFFVYLALWIAIPLATTDLQKKTMYGSEHNRAMSQEWEQHPGSRIGNAFNEIFKAIGKVLFIIVRVLLIIFGVALVLTGFLSLLTLVMVFIFKYPGSFSTDAVGINLAYLPDFLNYIVTPRMVPWIKCLIVSVVSLPLLAIIYGGIRMIFWFRVRDGFLWLAFLVFWVLSAAALSIILFDEGISFAETAKTTSSDTYFKDKYDTIYVLPARKLTDMQIDKEIIIPDEFCNVYISDSSKTIYIKTILDISPCEDKTAKVEIKKRSAGRSRMEALDKAEKLQYNFKITGDTLFLDEYFTLPDDRKWSFDKVWVKLYAPEGTIIFMDKTTENQFHTYADADNVSASKNRFWKLTEDGLSYLEPNHRNK
jgi:phage shock protein PspC (stress-responsive transcriptional regulator)